MMVSPWPRLPAIESPITATFNAPGGTFGGAGTFTFAGLCVNSLGTAATAWRLVIVTGLGAVSCCGPIRAAGALLRGAAAGRAAVDARVDAAGGLGTAS